MQSLSIRQGKATGMQNLSEGSHRAGNRRLLDFFWMKILNFRCKKEKVEKIGMANAGTHNQAYPDMEPSHQAMSTHVKQVCCKFPLYIDQSLINPKYFI